MFAYRFCWSSLLERFVMVDLSLDLTTLARGYADGSLSVATVMKTVLARIEAAGDDRVWISRCCWEEVIGRAEALDGMTREQAASLPLFGIPFAVKDNIDVEGMPTTAACPDFAYVPERTSPVVQSLLDAGAVLIGKTNLDQFATGIVGVRSTYGIPRNRFDERYIPGGSSSGSAVAVAAGLVSFALGTDTAGSGRVPAAFNNIVGLKPTRGLVSTRGVVPACKSLDCVSVFPLSAQDALTVLDVAAYFDLHDPLAREASSAELRSFGQKPRFGVPPPGDLEFFGDHEAESLFAAAIVKLERVGGIRANASFAPFRDAGRLLYNGPWLAERLHATQALLDDDPDAVLPLTRSIIEKGRDYSALDAYRAQYELARLKREA